MSIFFVDDEEELEQDKPSSTSSSKETDTFFKKVSEDEVLENLKNRVNRQRKIKTSVFSSLDKEILQNLSDYISSRQMSYRVALDKLKKLYPDNQSLQTKRHESLRYFLIKHGFINNEKALKTIHKSISNSEYAKNKRKRIIEDVINELIENHLDKIIEHPIFIEKIKEKFNL
jgi:hypothetical protein